MFIAMLFDLTTYKVSNKFILAGSLVGVVYRFSQYQFYGILYFLLGAFVPILLLFLLFITKVIGSGDIKLFAIISGCFGASFGMTCIWYSFVAGAILSIFLLIFRRNFLLRFRYFIHYVKNCFLRKAILPYGGENHDEKSVFHFTIAIFTGFLCLGIQKLQKGVM